MFTKRHSVIPVSSVNIVSTFSCVSIVSIVNNVDIVILVKTLCIVSNVNMLIVLSFVNLMSCMQIKIVKKKISACFCDELFSPFTNDSLRQSTKIFPTKFQNVL